MKVIDLYQQQTDLISMAIENNRQAQQKIYSQHAPKMLGVCRQYIKDIHHAEDLLITSFMKIFSNLSNFEHKGNFEGWIRRIVINECISYIRVHKKITFIDDEDIIEETFNNAESDFTVDDIQFLIDNLPEGCKMIFNLYAIEGYKHKEIAEILGINEGTSKSQLANARRILQAQINKMKEYEYGAK